MYLYYAVKGFESDGDGRGDGTKSWHRDGAHPSNFDFSGIRYGGRMCCRQRRDRLCLLGDDYRRILPGAILGGGFFLMICDTLARTVTAPGELPVGVLTAIVGAPYLILLIKKKLA